MGGNYDEKEMRQWRRERNGAVASLDIELYRAYYKKWSARGYCNVPLSDDDREVEAEVNKLAVELKGIPTSRREEARDWLRHNGYKEEI